MAFYRVLLHGEGIRLHWSDPPSPAVGFYTSRTLWARSPEQAAARAVHAVRGAWAEGALAKANSGLPPILTIESVTTASVLQWLTAPNKGHTFYLEEPNAAG